MAPRFLTPEELDARRGASEIARLAGGSAPAVLAAIAAAEAEAVSFLISRYGDRLPLLPENTPEVLKDKVAALAHRYLAKGPQVSQTLVDEAKDARSWLSQVARNVASLDLPDDLAKPVDRAGPLFLSNRSECEDPPLDWNTLRNW